MDILVPLKMKRPFGGQNLHEVMNEMKQHKASALLL